MWAILIAPSSLITEFGGMLQNNKEKLSLSTCYVLPLIHIWAKSADRETGPKIRPVPKILGWLLLTFVISGKTHSSCLWNLLYSGHCSVAEESWEGAMPARTYRDKRKMKPFSSASFSTACSQMYICLATLFKANVVSGHYSHIAKGKRFPIEM